MQISSLACPELLQTISSHLTGLGHDEDRGRFSADLRSAIAPALSPQQLGAFDRLCGRLHTIVAAVHRKARPRPAQLLCLPMAPGCWPATLMWAKHCSPGVIAASLRQQQQQQQQQHMRLALEAVGFVKSVCLCACSVRADCAACQQGNMRCMVDAEQTYMQPVMDALTIQLQQTFNRDAPVVFNTYQCYLKSTEQRCAGPGFWQIWVRREGTQAGAKRLASAARACRLR